MERDLDLEVQACLQMLIDAKIESGLPPKEARRQAMAQLGGLEPVKESVRQARAGRFLENRLQDLRHGSRILMKAPGFAAAAVLTLAVGIGANACLFSIVNAVLLHALPFRDPGRLVFIHETQPDIPKFAASYPDFEDWRVQNTSFEQMAAYATRDYNKPVLMLHGEPLQVAAAFVSDQLVSLLSMQPQHGQPQYGRAFGPEDERAGQDQVVILSHRLWQQSFGSDPNIVGKSIEIDGKPQTVAGIMGQGDQFPAGVDIWLPFSQWDASDLAHRQNRRVWVIGRLKPGVTESHALAELRSIQRRLDAAYPDADKNVDVAAIGLLDQYTGGIKTILLVLLGAATLVMLVGCANVANLLLARAANRKTEMAIRAAHGASPGRIFGQLMTESLLLAALGSVGGVAIAYAATPVLKHWAAGVYRIPRLDGARIDPAVLGFTAGVALLTGLLFGTLPAIQASRTDLNRALKQGGRQTSGSMQGRLRALLIIGEVAVAVTVLIGAGLLVRSLEHLVQVDPGFRTGNLLTVQLKVSESKYPIASGRMENFYVRLLEKVKALPGVKGVAVINILPVVPSLSLMHFGVADAPPRQLAAYPIAQIRTVSLNYFELMSIPITKGRNFQKSDLAKAQRGVIINETLARTQFPGQDPVGKGLLVVEAPKPFALPIVGVAANVKDLGLDREPEPEIYFLGFWYDEILLVHTAVDPASLTPAIRREVRSLDPYQPIGQVRTMRDIVDDSLSKRKLLANLMTMFSGLALALAGLGIYGVMSYSVAQRTSEIGLRMALGARARDIIGLLLRQGTMPVMIGLVIGLISAWSSKKVLSGLMYGVSSMDGMTYCGVAGLIVLTAVAATLVPSFRAVRVDPLIALRQQ